MYNSYLVAIEDYIQLLTTNPRDREVVSAKYPEEWPVRYSAPAMHQPRLREN
ncbi:hypothetical protein [Sodalis sp.]|uniref:hypothetical protein n=1 Tax=Sodalis sp. (in: enterobacteria) TaxID=1898979 RepID=UPI00387308FC